MTLTYYDYSTVYSYDYSTITVLYARLWYSRICAEKGR